MYNRNVQETLKKGLKFLWHSSKGLKVYYRIYTPNVRIIIS